jgi:hypothetical protein
MLTDHDRDLEEALAPLREARPSIDAHALVARAPGRRRRHGSRRLVAAMATATAVVGVAFAALPSHDTPDRPQTAAGLLRATAAVAADQPEPPAWAGYRYVKSIERWTSQPMESPKEHIPPRPIGEPYTVEKTSEVWVDRHWRGRQIASKGKLVAGRLPDGRSGLMKPSDGPYQYGDGPLGNVPLSELPTDPKQLYELLVAAYKDLRWAPDVPAHEPQRPRSRPSWAPGHPTPAQIHHDVLRNVLLLLTNANVTGAQRAALIEVLGQYEGVEPLPAVRDRLHREGRGVEIPVTELSGRPESRIRVIFSPDTSEVLEWSHEGGISAQVHTFVRFGHVAAIGDRP